MSRSQALLEGIRGVNEYEYTLYRSDIEGREIEELGTVEGATVSLDNAREHTWELSLPMREAENLDIFGDWVKPVVFLRDGDEWLRYPMGLYRFGFPRGTDTPLSRQYDLTGKSPEDLLVQDMANYGYRVDEGAWILRAVNTILTDKGIPSGRINFPPTGTATSDVQLTTTAFFDPLQDAQGCYWLRICNTLLAAGGFYALFTDTEGRFTTHKIESGPEVRTDVTYGSEPNTERLITDEIGFEYGDEEFANRIVVYGGDPSLAPPIVGIAENRDPDSRVSIQKIGVVQPDPFVEQFVANLAEAELLAKARLRIASGTDIKLSIPTVPDPRRKPREIYGLDVRNEAGDVLWDGRWRVQGWNLPLDLSAMTHEVIQEVAL